MSLIKTVPNLTTGLSPDDLKLLREWTEQKHKAIQEDPLNHGLPPHAGQRRVHDSEANEILLIAANRWGKSTCGMREVLWRARGEHPYKQVRLSEVIWCGFVDFGFYNRVTYRHFKAWVPKEHLIHFHESEKWAQIRRVDGGICTIYFLSYESGRESWQGAPVDFIWLDEELPEDIYREAYARVIDKRGQLLLTQTPVSGLSWAYDEIYLPSMSGARKGCQVIQGALATKDETREFGVGESLVPHLDREQIVRFASIIKDPDERDIRVFGEFKGRSGGVYKMFDPTVHVIPPFAIPNHFEVWGGVDPGYHGFAATLMAMDPMGRVYVAAEFYSQQENHTRRAEDLWELVKQTYPQHMADEEEYFIFYCDTANPQDILELNHWAQEANTRMAFASLDQGLKARDAGVGRVQEYMTPMPGRTKPPHVVRTVENVKGEPMLYFFDSLHSTWQDDESGFATSRVIWETQRYLWKKRKKTAAHPDGADDASAGGAHALSALRYAMMARLGAPEAEAEPIGRDSMIRRHVERLEGQMLARQAQ